MLTMVPNPRSHPLTALLAVVAATTILIPRSVSGQGCSNTCPPINYGVVVPALCEGDRIDGGGSTLSDGVRADVQKEYDICFPKPTTTSSSPSSFKFDDFRGENVVTVVANYYTGCNAGRRESGVFAHVAQKYYDLYGPDRVRFVQSVKGGGTCDQWSAIYQADAAELFPGEAVPTEMPWSVDDSSYVIRDEFFTSPFGHPAYVVLDGNLEIKHKFIGPCCGYERYRDCTPEIARGLDATLSEYLDAILNNDTFVLENPSGSGEQQQQQQQQQVEDEPTEATPLDCQWSEWSACSIRCGPTPGIQIRTKDRRCSSQESPSSSLLETRPCLAFNSNNCNVEDGGFACVPEFGEIWNVRKGVVENLDSPRDVKFHPTPGYHLGRSSEGISFYDQTEGNVFGDYDDDDEAWIINGNNHTISIVASLDTARESILPRRDRGYYHYMINGTAISFNSVSNSGRMSDKDTFNYWSICNDNSNTYTGTKEPNYFMGPTLYDSNPNNRNLVNRLGEQCDVLSGDEAGGGGNKTTTSDEPCYFLHSDMLHEAPSCRGIVHDPETETAYGTVYWAFDSTGNRQTGQLVRFDFQQPHGPGSMDHSIASVRRYVEVELETTEEATGQAGVHAGMVVHPTRRELFIAVPGKNRILRVAADSGKFARTAREEYPIFSNRLPSFEYSIWECVDQSVFADNIDQPSGMALSEDGERLFVAERGTGSIRAYEVATGAFLYAIPTEFKTIGGMDFAPRGGDLYFVDDETNTLNSVRVLTECPMDYASRVNPDFTKALDDSRVALGLEASQDPLDLLPETCQVDAIVPNATFFDQVHLDTGYASDNPDVQSVMAGMDEEAALLANRTDCGYDSELNFDALLLGGYFCHTCLPEQDQTCDGGGSCQNVQWLGYICDNEFRVVPDSESASSGNYLLQTMNGTTLDSSEVVLKPGITYKFYAMTNEVVCLYALESSEGDLQNYNRDDLKVGSVSRSSGSQERDSVTFSTFDEVVNLGCATNGRPVVWAAGDLELTSPQIYTYSLADPDSSYRPRLSPRDRSAEIPSSSSKSVESSSSKSVDRDSVCVLGGLFGTLFGFYFFG